MVICYKTIPLKYQRTTSRSILHLYSLSYYKALFRNDQKVTKVKTAFKFSACNLNKQYPDIIGPLQSFL